MTGRILVVAALALLLAGCTTTSQQLAEQDDLKCTSFGLKPGTPGYAQCRLSMQQDHAAAEQQQQGQRDNMFMSGLALLAR